MNQPKETPKQEQKKKPEENNSVPAPPTPVPPPNPVPPPVPPVPKAKQVTISVKGNNGYIMGAKRWMYKMAILCIKYYNVQD